MNTNIKKLEKLFDYDFYNKNYHKYKEIEKGIAFDSGCDIDRAKSLQLIKRYKY